MNSPGNGKNLTFMRPLRKIEVHKEFSRVLHTQKNTNRIMHQMQDMTRIHFDVSPGNRRDMAWSAFYSHDFKGLRAGKKTSCQQWSVIFFFGYLDTQGEKAEAIDFLLLLENDCQRFKRFLLFPKSFSSSCDAVQSIYRNCIIIIEEDRRFRFRVPKRQTQLCRHSTEWMCVCAPPALVFLLFGTRKREKAKVLYDGYGVTQITSLNRHLGLETIHSRQRLYSKLFHQSSKVD